MKRRYNKTTDTFELTSNRLSLTKYCNNPEREESICSPCEKMDEHGHCDYQSRKLLCIYDQTPLVKQNEFFAACPKCGWGIDY